MLAGIVAALAFAAPAVGGAGERDRPGGGHGRDARARDAAHAPPAAAVVRDGHSCSGTSALRRAARRHRRRLERHVVRRARLERRGHQGRAARVPQLLRRSGSTRRTRSSGSATRSCRPATTSCVVPAAEGPILDLTGVPPRVAAGQAVTVDRDGAWRDVPRGAAVRPDPHRRPGGGRDRQLRRRDRDRRRRRQGAARLRRRRRGDRPGHRGGPRPLRRPPRRGRRPGARRPAAASAGAATRPRRRRPSPRRWPTARCSPAATRRAS